LFDLRKQTQLSKFDIEIMCYANTQSLFSAYQIRQFFNNTTPQQIYRSIRSLIHLKVIEALQVGRKGKPTYYMITEKGKTQFFDYLSALEDMLNINVA
jgi:DNA-binding PadR family transcriptional regulator